MSNLTLYISVCRTGNESEEMALVSQEPGITSKQQADGMTGLMWSLVYQHHSLSRQILAHPGLDTDIRTGNNVTALHWACWTDTPLDIVIIVTKLSSWETLNRKVKGCGDTALDRAVRNKNTSTELYLSWLGADCKAENKKYTDVTLQTWIEAGCQQEAQFWAVAANDLESLMQLTRMENVNLDKPKLLGLATLFDQKEVWSYLTSLQSLAWARLQQSVPSVRELTPEELLEKKVDGNIVRVLLMYRQTEPSNLIE